MIAGENEALIGQAIGMDTEYDNLFGIGKGKNRQNKPKKQREGKFWKGLGNFYKDAGGVQGLGTTLGNIVSAFRPIPGGQASGDFQFGMQNTPGAPSNQKEGISTGVFVIGGVVVVGVIAFVAFGNNKNQVITQGQP